MDRDPQVTQYIEGPWQNPSAHDAFLLRRMAITFARPFGYWSIATIEAPETFLGWVMLLPDDGPAPTAELGWRLNRKSWGQGVATEAALCLVNLALDLSPDLEIYASIHPENLASINVAEKIGMQIEPKASRQDPQDLVYFLKANGAQKKAQTEVRA